MKKLVALLLALPLPFGLVALAEQPGAQTASSDRARARPHRGSRRSQVADLSYCS